MSLLKSLRSTPTFKSLEKLHTDLMGYRRMGLKYDDLIPDENNIVKEAVRRLPPREYQERMFRMRRALVLSTTQSTLEPHESTKPGEDVHYLRPLINQVESEVATKQYFENLTLKTIPQALRKRNRSS